MGLSDTEKAEIIRYRVEKANETLQEARDNADLGHWSLAANRMYYSVFYITLALLLKNNITAKSHSGVFSIFSKEYIRTGLVNEEHGKLYRILFSMRQTGDYDDLFDWTAPDILPLLPKVESFHQKINSLILVD